MVFTIMACLDNYFFPVLRAKLSFHLHALAKAPTVAHFSLSQKDQGLLLLVQGNRACGFAGGEGRFFGVSHFPDSVEVKGGNVITCRS